MLYWRNQGRSQFSPMLLLHYSPHPVWVLKPSTLSVPKRLLKLVDLVLYQEESSDHKRYGHIWTMCTLLFGTYMLRVHRDNVHTCMCMCMCTCTVCVGIDIQIDINRWSHPFSEPNISHCILQIIMFKVSLFPLRKGRSTVSFSFDHNKKSLPLKPLYMMLCEPYIRSWIMAFLLCFQRFQPTSFGYVCLCSTMLQMYLV